MHGHQFRNTALVQVRPNRFEFRAVRQAFENFDAGLWFRFRPLGNKFRFRQTCSGLLFHDATLLQAFRGVFADDVPALGDEATNRIE